MAGPESPGRAVVRIAHAIDEPAKLRGGDGDDIVELVGKALPRRVPVLDGRPSAQLALLSLALPSSKAERPSRSRRLTSLPSVAPTMVPLEATTITTSGSGLFHRELGWIPASTPVPTADRGCALEKISASGPRPTSRYWLQAPCASSTCLRSLACDDPGLSRAKSPPTRRLTSSPECL